MSLLILILDPEKSPEFKKKGIENQQDEIFTRMVDPDSGVKYQK